jgi:hypothetical protein
LLQRKRAFNTYGVEPRLGKDLRGEVEFGSGKWMRTATLVIAIGAAVFLVGFAWAFLSGYQVNERTHESPLSDREFDEYQVFTLFEITIASIGLGVVSYGYVYDEFHNDAGMISKSGFFIGAVVCALGAGTASWALLATQHLDMPTYEPDYQTLRVWTLLGPLVSLIGLVIALRELKSSIDVGPAKRHPIHLRSHMDRVSDPRKRPHRA